LAQKGIKYFSGNSEYKDELKKILDSISKNKALMSDIVKIISDKEEIDDSIANKIVKLGFIQNQIKKTKLDETELENQLKIVLIKSWNELSSKSVEKVKKDLK